MAVEEQVGDEAEDLIARAVAVAAFMEAGVMCSPEKNKNVVLIAMSLLIASQYDWHEESIAEACGVIKRNALRLIDHPVAQMFGVENLKREGNA